MRKFVVTESILKRCISEELKKSDVVDVVKKDKDIEKYIKKVTADVLSNLFQTLWQQKGYVMSNIAK